MPSRGPLWRRLALLIVLAVALYVASRFEDRGLPGEVRGRARLVDGDSLYVGGAEVRLIGIDAPEGRQECQREGRSWPCGREAEATLARLIGGVEIVCAIESRDKHGRMLAVCGAGGRDLNRAMVESGMAVAYGRYRAEETAAHAARRGLWSGTFERPRDWRDRNNASVEG